MREIGPDDLYRLSDDAGAVWAALRYEPRKRSFNVARAALKRMGAVYDYRVRAWRVPASQDVLGPLERLYRASSLALYVADDGEDVTRDSFSRYL